MKSDDEYDAGRELKSKRKENVKEVEQSREYCGELKKYVVNHEGKQLLQCKLCNSTFKEVHNLLENIKTLAGRTIIYIFIFTQ